MKLSKITLTLIASGLRSFAEAVENMAEEAETLTPKVADESEKTEQPNKEESSGSTDIVEETEAQKKSRIRKERRLAKKKKDAEEAAAEKEDDSFLEEGDEAISKDDVKAALVALAKAEGNAAAKEILTKYKAANISKVKASDYAAVMADIEEAME